MTDTATPTDVVPFQQAAMEPAVQTHLNTLWKQAQLLSQMNLLPAELKNSPASVFGVVLFGEQYGLSPAQAVSQLWIIKGRIVPSSQVYAGVAMRSGHEVRIEESSSERCVVAIKRRGTDYWQRVTFTIEDAKTAGLANKEIWKQYPGDMLAHATMRRAVKRICPDALLGIAEVGDDGVRIDELAAQAPAAHAEERVIDIDLELEDEDLVGDDQESGEGAGDREAPGRQEAPPSEDEAPSPDATPDPAEERAKAQRGLMATATKAFPKIDGLAAADQRTRQTAQRHAIAYVALGEHKSANDMTIEELRRVSTRLQDVIDGYLRLEERDGQWVAIQNGVEIPIPAEAA